MSQTIDLLRDSTLQKTNAILAVIAKNSGGNPGEPSAEDIRTIIRGGAAEQYFEVGEQISCYKATAGAATTNVSGGSVTVDYLKFVGKMRSAAPGPYEFIYDGAAWRYRDHIVTLADYGLALTGTAAADNAIVVTLTATELNWDIVDFDQKVWKAWMYGTSVYYTVLANPGANELVFTLNGQTFAYAGFVSTAYNNTTKQIGITLVAGTVLVCDRAKEHDTVDGVNRHSVELLLHDGYANIQFDATEAIYANRNETELAAGNYFLTIEGKSYQFALATALPAGGQIVATWADDPTRITKFTTYSGPTSTTALESDIVPTEGTAGTELTGLNHYHRTRWGNNCIKTSGIRQWLNSDKAGSAWWNPQHAFDRPSAHASTEGFLRGIDPEFLDMVGATNCLVNLNRMTVPGNNTNYVDPDDNGVTATADRIGINVIRDRFSLASFTEYYCGKLTCTIKGSDKSVSINAPLKYYSRMAVSPTTAAISGRIKYRNGSACYWWGRSAYPYHAHSVCIVDTSGVRGGNYATNTGGAAVPACSLI